MSDVIYKEHIATIRQYVNENPSDTKVSELFSAFIKKCIFIALYKRKHKVIDFEYNMNDLHYIIELVYMGQRKNILKSMNVI